MKKRSKDTESKKTTPEEDGQAVNAEGIPLEDLPVGDHYGPAPSTKQLWYVVAIIVAMLALVIAQRGF